MVGTGIDLRKAKRQKVVCRTISKYGREADKGRMLGIGGMQRRQQDSDSNSTNLDKAKEQSA